MFDLFTAPVGKGYSRDLSPGLLHMALLLQNVDISRAWPNKIPRCLVIGPGDGLSTLFHAAAQPWEWWLATPNPDHALQVRELAAISGATVHVLERDLDDMARSTDLPGFDLIVLPGLWSSTNDQGRQLVLSLVHQRLNTGGVVLLTYDALPGCAELGPLRDMLVLHAAMTGSRSETPEERAQHALEHLALLEKNNAAFFRNVPHRIELLRNLERLPLSLLCSLISPSWRPYYVADVAHVLGQVKLSFVSSVRLLRQHDGLCAPASGQDLLRVGDPIQRETVRDCFLNTATRADIFVKGKHTMTLEEQISTLSPLRVGLTRELENFPLTLPTPVGVQQLCEDLYRPLLAALGEQDYRPKTLEELEDHPLLKKVESKVLLEMLAVLVGAGFAHPAVAVRQDQQAVCARLNAALCDRAGADPTASWLASPVMGAGVPVSRLEQLLLRAMARNNDSTPREWATEAWMTLAGNGEKLMRDNVPMSFDDAEQEIINIAEVFAVQRLPLLRTLGVIPEAGAL